MFTTDRDREIGQVSHSPAQKRNGLRAMPVSLHSSPNRGPARRAQNTDLEKWEGPYPAKSTHILIIQKIEYSLKDILLVQSSPIIKERKSNRRPSVGHSPIEKEDYPK